MRTGLCLYVLRVQVLDMLRFIQATAWPYLFGKSAEELQQGAAVGAFGLPHHGRHYLCLVSLFTATAPPEPAAFSLSHVRFITHAFPYNFTVSGPVLPRCTMYCNV